MTNTFYNISSSLINHRKMIVRGGFLVVLLTMLFSNSAFAIDTEFLEYCVGEVFDAKYNNAECWSCDISKVLVRSLMGLTETLFNEVKSLSIIVLQLGGAIWLAIYFMKSLSSLAAQDPAKVLDGALIFMFKWAVIYTIVFAGIDAVMDYIVNPLLSIGFDVGMDLAGVSGISGL